MTQARAELGVPIRLLRVMVAAPGDVQPEIQIVNEVVLAWNEAHAEAEGTVLLVKHWTTHAHPQLGDRPQAIINEQLVDQADILVALFWTRLGTPTGVAESGTVEELRQFHASGRPVKLYFSQKAVPHGLLQDGQRLAEYGRLTAFQQEVQSWGLYESYASEDAFRQLFTRQIYQEVRAIRQREFRTQRPEPPAAPVSPPPVPVGLRTLQRTLIRLRGDWEAERDSQPFGHYDKGKLIMGRLASAVSEHRADLAEDLQAEELATLQQIITNARSYSKFLVTFGSADHFWGPGTQFLEQATDAVQAMLVRRTAAVGAGQ
jgi:hypothetical protein